MSGRWKCLLIPHALLMVLVLVIAQAPKLRPGLSSCVALLTAVGVIEGAFLLFLCLAWRRGESGNACVDIILLVWALLLVWELYASVWDRAHPGLVPAPEDVFDTFREQWPTLLQNVWHSLLLLAVGFSLGMYLAVLLGLVAGWYPRLRGFACPIANVMAPIPPVVFSPYLVALMPSFRSASALVIVLGVFWPTFLGTINRVAGIEPQLLDSARILRPSNRVMIFHILLPYVFPEVVSGLKVSLTSSLLMLNFAELMGATHGMGYYVQNSIAYANYAHAVAGIIVIGVVVTILGALVTWCQRKLIHWR